MTTASDVKEPPRGSFTAQTSKTLPDFLPELPRPAVIATVVRVAGSAPQEAGARMWIAAAEFRGTVGGGELERRVLADALGLLAQDSLKPILKEYVLCKELGQCCGGRVEVFLEPVPRRKTVHLLGGGHVGRAVAEVLAGTPLELHLVDPRPDWSGPQGLPAQARPRREDPREYARLRSWASQDAVCIFTHSHDLDFDLARFFLGKPVGYLGLIGSEHKARVFRRRLEAEDPALAALWDERMRCPIGLPLQSKNPKVVAVAVAAQLLQDWALAPAASARRLPPAPLSNSI